MKISRYKNLFARGYTPNWSDEVFMAKKVKNTIPWEIQKFNNGEIVAMLYEKELQKTNQTEFRNKNLIKEKGDKLFVKWKGYESYFNS